MQLHEKPVPTPSHTDKLPGVVFIFRFLLLYIANTSACVFVSNNNI